MKLLACVSQLDAVELELRSHLAGQPAQSLPAQEFQAAQQKLPAASSAAVTAVFGAQACPAQAGNDGMAE